MCGLTVVSPLTLRLKSSFVSSQQVFVEQLVYKQESSPAPVRDGIAKLEEKNIDVFNLMSNHKQTLVLHDIVQLII